MSGVICHRRIAASVKRGLQDGSDLCGLEMVALTKRQQAKVEMLSFTGSEEDGED